MIISLRGTSGSGKSTLVRCITALYESDGVPVHVDGRRKAYFTIHRRADGGRELVVPGHYDIANGGVDTLDSLDEAYDIARRADSEGRDVLMEGKCMSDGVHHALEMQREKRDIRIVHINISIEKCVRSVRRRGHSIAEHSIARTHDKVLRNVADFRAFGFRVFQGERDDCQRVVANWLGLRGRLRGAE